MNEHRRNKSAYAASWVLFGFVATFFVWLFWPYPHITTEGKSVLVNLPSDEIYKTGDIIRWTKSKVCQPEGLTSAEIWAIREPAKGELAVVLKTLIAHREFEVLYDAPDCRENNPTSVYVSGNLATGIYSFEVRACLYNPTPQPNCDVYPGPSGVKIQRVVGNEPTIKP